MKTTSHFWKATGLLTMLVLSQTAWPCINRLETKYDGTPAARTSHSRFGELKLSLLTDTEVDGAQMERDLRGAREFSKRNDYAVALMYLGRSAEAVSLLRALEREKPGNYYIETLISPVSGRDGKGWWQRRRGPMPSPSGRWPG